MKRILLCFLLSSLFLPLPATTIVIYITPEFVIMAADSKGVYTNAKTYEKTTSVVSKIYKTGNVYFSLAGLTSNTTQSLDIAKTVNDNLSKSDNVATAVQQMKASVQKALLTYLSNQKKNNPVLFKDNLAGDRYITSVGIVTIKNNKPYSHIIGFRVLDRNELRITTEEEVYTPDVKRDAVYYLGTSREINRYMNTITSNNMQPVPFVEKLMNLQINKTPELTAAPVDIIKITPSKTVWVKRKKGTPVELGK
jgi:ATP-dependent protease HslVU (ClpYQ) peptidase subunit